MLKEFYTNIDRYGNKLLYRGYDSEGKRVQKRVPYKPTLYLQSKNKRLNGNLFTVRMSSR